ncbi:MAG: GerMN domain-containing protein [Chloroflexota bacterium]|jgi:germination protein M
MNAQPSIALRRTVVAIASLATVIAACSPSIGAAGTVQPAASSAAPIVASGSPDATPDASVALASPSSSPASSPKASGASGSPAATVGPTRQPSSQPTTRPSQGAPSPSATPVPATTIVRSYFFLQDQAGGDPGLVAVLRIVPATQAVATAAVNALLKGPTPAEASASPRITTVVPKGTELLGITVNGGIATVDLSREFASGGGSASVVGRLAQVVYTLTQFPSVNAVKFKLDGVPVTTFGGQGVALDKPVGRADYYPQLPDIFVDRPVWRAAGGNPMRVAGLANVFEATFRVALLDATGRTLADQQVMASCGTGCEGTFDVRVPYSVSKAQWGTLRAYNLSAKDGSRESVRDYPIWLTPGG